MLFRFWNLCADARFAIAALALIFGLVVATDSRAADVFKTPHYVVETPRSWAPAAHSWTGMYVGVIADYGFAGSSKNETRTSFGGGAAMVSDMNMSLKDSWALGAVVGYNWQVNNWLVVGLETDFNLIVSGGNGSRTTVWCTPIDCAGLSGRTVNTVSSDWYGTTRARLGFLPWQNVMIYGTGGVAYGDFKTSTADHCSGIPGVSCTFRMNKSVFKLGWVAGAGLEWAFARNWTVKAEYLHFDYGVLDSTSSCCGSFVSRTKVGLTDDRVRIGVNYRF